MLLTVSTQRFPATDLSILLHKRPDRFQSFDLSFGVGHVYYSEATEQECTVCLQLEIDPVSLIRRETPNQNTPFALENYVNDRPYVCSSFMSVALSQIFGTAMNGRCKIKPELANEVLPLTVRLDVVACSGGEAVIRRLFEPLGYTVTLQRHTLDDQFPEWGEGNVFSIQLSGQVRLATLFSQLYVLIPVLDNDKHYFVADAEVEKLLEKGSGWLETHPDMEFICRRFLRNQIGLQREAVAQLESATGAMPDETDLSSLPSSATGRDPTAAEPTTATRLNESRYESVLQELIRFGALHVLDLGCGEGKFLKALVDSRKFHRIVGVDPSLRALEIAKRRLNLEKRPESQQERIQLFQGSAAYRDERFHGFDAITLVEVVEHMEPHALVALEKVVFKYALPEWVVITTPNREYNALWPSLPAGKMRHSDHRFEWTRAEFETWSKRVAKEFGYSVEFQGIGEPNPEFGSPTQMCIFQRVLSEG